MENIRIPIENESQKRNLTNRKILLSSLLTAGGVIGFVSATDLLSSNNEISNSPVDETSEGQLSSQPSTELSLNVENVALVDSKLSFAEAFRTQRELQGEGGIFKWNDKYYNTFYKEEWESMSNSDKDEYFASIEKYIDHNSASLVESDENGSKETKLSDMAANSSPDVSETDSTTEDNEIVDMDLGGFEELDDDGDIVAPEEILVNEDKTNLENNTENNIGESVNTEESDLQFDTLNDNEISVEKDSSQVLANEGDSEVFDSNIIIDDNFLEDGDIVQPSDYTIEDGDLINPSDESEESADIIQNNESDSFEEGDLSAPDSFIEEGDIAVPSDNENIDISSDIEISSIEEGDIEAPNEFIEEGDLMAPDNFDTGSQDLASPSEEIFEGNNNIITNILEDEFDF